MLTAEQLVKRLIALIVPKGLHLTNFHGVLAPAATARSTVASQMPVARSSPAPTERKQKKDKRPRIDWATLLVTSPRTAERMLQSMGRLHQQPPLPDARGPPQQQLLPT